MKKVLTTLLVSSLVLSAGVVAFADSVSSPAEIYSNLSGKTVEQAYELRGTNKSFGELAKENGFFDKFQAAILEAKKHILADKVENKEITQEKADELIKLMEENCDGTGTQKLGQKNGIRFGMGAGNGQGRGQGKGLGRGPGNGMGRGNGLGRNK
ncbi:hypothetical protein R9X47_18285 [Wukongibacter baidiensis]|uniref:hypothetical protein n=1 Tax=Wukongibacter baidiensis TaxID=1723361 RepID=UPI003D7F8B22